MLAPSTSQPSSCIGNDAALFPASLKPVISFSCRCAAVAIVKLARRPGPEGQLLTDITGNNMRLNREDTLEWW